MQGRRLVIRMEQELTDMIKIKTCVSQLINTGNYENVRFEAEMEGYVKKEEYAEKFASYWKATKNQVNEQHDLLRAKLQGDEE